MAVHSMFGLVATLAQIMPSSRRSCGGLISVAARLLARGPTLSHKRNGLTHTSERANERRERAPFWNKVVPNSYLSHSLSRSDGSSSLSSFLAQYH